MNIWLRCTSWDFCFVGASLPLSQLKLIMAVGLSKLLQGRWNKTLLFWLTVLLTALWYFSSVLLWLRVVLSDKMWIELGNLISELQNRYVYFYRQGGMLLGWAITVSVCCRILYLLQVTTWKCLATLCAFPWRKFSSRLPLKKYCLYFLDTLFIETSKCNSCVF